MRHFVKAPNLPARQIDSAAIGEDYAEEIGAALSAFGIKILSCPINTQLDPRLRSHIDLSVFHIGGNRFLLSRTLNGSSFEAELKALGAEIAFTEAFISPEYPRDAILCALSNGEFLFHNLKLSDKALLNNITFRKIDVRQGYSKCAVCFVSDKAAITSDKGLAIAMKCEGIDILEISPGGIGLKGFNEGFIGGSAFKIDKDLLAFTGHLDRHPDRQSIYAFLLKHKVEPIILCKKSIFDIGSVIPLTEKEKDPI